MSDPRAYTNDEVRDMLIVKIRQIAKYWATQANVATPLERCEGTAFSILSMLDGCTLELPAFDLVARPHPEDKEYHRENGENWFEDGETLSTALHEFFHKKG